MPEIRTRRWNDESMPDDGTRILITRFRPVSYTHLRAHETVLDLVCRLLLEKKKIKLTYTHTHSPTNRPHKHTGSLTNAHQLNEISK